MPVGATIGKLIVVDDDQEVRSIVADFLADAGYRVLQAADGAQALGLIADDPSRRMMISDKMSGIELAEEAVRLRPKLRVILISGFTDHQITEWPLLMKPFHRSKLCRLVAHEMRQA